MQPGRSSPLSKRPNQSKPISLIHNKFLKRNIYNFNIVSAVAEGFAFYFTFKNPKFFKLYNHDRVPLRNPVGRFVPVQINPPMVIL